MAVGFDPMVEVDLAQVGGDNFFAQLVRFDAEKRHAKSRQRCDQRMRDLIRVRGSDDR